ncbi:hypothetical protein GUITHDRAFT_151252 [Guillardia theta CCMP2712]|uniref:RWP-RK domain-containing protein n=1 Tax=Guillardia theta (strain CCMP2712) TaxID=905079 RepID=L1JNR7_GUITC|nr:hypothetical protein GUITHDRAFT_151252 [Guillardia theta CCMP2712]EKX50226.1 hypothetical protein GUITHDRAFT_151252 [Guillardia theta CCMP2712]|mmetsp:Transcript_10061/g.33510  ORF Transcript_10061/g.33510 Transcript_10061/m.33510 type:complete len:148 (-) Transcript_10061:108-551(-)|eukprot:XP_005837206.1 hypothetical protein GUITHDRAFT_151252 [Guillardia theta CCMP2712]
MTTDVARIFPRRKAGETSISASKSVVTLSKKDISMMFHMKQGDAANMLGISLTALKKACRRVGIDKWPYVRATPTLQLVAPCKSDVDSILAFFQDSTKNGIQAERPEMPAQQSVHAEEEEGHWPRYLVACFDTTLLLEEALKHVESY